MSQMRHWTDRGAAKFVNPGQAVDFVPDTNGVAASRARPPDFVPPTNGVAAGAALMASRAVGRRSRSWLHAQEPRQDRRRGQLSRADELITLALDIEHLGDKTR